jgi:hypothetical protein
VNTIEAAARRAYMRASKCVYCGEHATALDHVRPKSRGGTEDMSNLVPACQLCNSEKHSLLLTEWDIKKVMFAVSRDIRILWEILSLTNRFDLINGPLSVVDQIRIGSKALNNPYPALVRGIIAGIRPEDTSGRMTLREMCDAGLVPRKYSAAKRARTRAGEAFPAGERTPAGILHDPAEVAGWFAGNRSN